MAKEKNVPAPADSFELDGKTYKVVLEAIIIPGIGLRSKGEILVDEEAQKALVAIESGAIQEQA